MDETTQDSGASTSHVERVVARYLAGLAYEPEAAASLARALSTEFEADVGPTQALKLLDDRVRHWLAGLVARTGIAVHPYSAAPRVALLTLEVGRLWPDQLLAATPSRSFEAAFAQALPLSLPPPAPLAMPAQSLTEWQDAGVAPPPPPEAPREPRLWRRLLIGTLTLGTTGLGCYELGRVFSPGGISAIEIVLMVLFTANFVWIALTFWTALAGLWAMARGPRALTAGLAPPAERLTARTAIIMPVYNESPERTFGALECIYRELEATGEIQHFDFFVLSDSTNIDAWIAEEQAWDLSRRRLGATGRFFYRRRYENSARKAGNLAEFCRRWGGHYQHMLVFDADSIMCGETLVRLAKLMQSNPHAGIIQTIPKLVNRNTLFARAHQFAGACYGPVLASGLAWWYLGDGNYWGHNAIMRLSAFAAHAGLPPLPGGPPFGGLILSHDFVEAALMRRAGWKVYLLPDDEGSFEEAPPSLIDHGLRDRRWCQGNLQHMRVIGASGLHPLSRLHLLTGIMAYLSSPLWFAFILVGIAAALETRFELPVYFFPDRTPYPVWHIIDPELAARVFAATMGFLLAPKLLGWLAICFDRERARRFGGRMKALGSVLSETLISALLAPLHMLFQSRFVFNVFAGGDSGWNTQSRDDVGTAWRDAWTLHRHHTFTGLVLAALAYAVYPGLLLWMSPALLSMVFAVPLSVLTSRPTLGLALRARGLLGTADENDPPPIIPAVAAARDELENLSTPLPRPALETIITDHRLGLLHLALVEQNPPAVITESMSAANDRAKAIRQMEALPTLLDGKLQAAALASPNTLRSLRRRLGRFRY
ncbi:MAG: glucans biosynthesis glucosyltransferase MdoH [Gammaproteobacteria bacterium]|nr:glucans biosynthesis glucosyltransferase MdoH [Gammaproteobacteria bacterium]